MEALRCILLRRFARNAVNTGFLPVLGCSFTDTFHGSKQVFVERSTDNRPANVVPEIPWSNQQDIDTWNLRNLLDLSWKSAFFVFLFQFDGIDPHSQELLSSLSALL